MLAFAQAHILRFTRSHIHIFKHSFMCPFAQIAQIAPFLHSGGHTLTRSHIRIFAGSQIPAFTHHAFGHSPTRANPARTGWPSVTPAVEPPRPTCRERGMRCFWRRALVPQPANPSFLTRHAGHGRVCPPSESERSHWRPNGQGRGLTATSDPRDRLGVGPLPAVPASGHAFGGVWTLAPPDPDSTRK
jgi:hypothetical protein